MLWVNNKWQCACFKWQCTCFKWQCACFLMTVCACFLMTMCMFKWQCACCSIKKSANVWYREVNTSFKFTFNELQLLYSSVFYILRSFIFFGLWMFWESLRHVSSVRIIVDIAGLNLWPHLNVLFEWLKCYFTLSLSLVSL